MLKRWRGFQRGDYRRETQEARGSREDETEKELRLVGKFLFAFWLREALP